MKPDQVIKNFLGNFFHITEVHTIVENIKWDYDENRLAFSPQLSLEVRQVDKRKIVITIKNNSQDGFTTFKKEYLI